MSDYNKEVQKFAMSMIKKLEKNNHRHKSWRQANNSHLLYCLKNEVKELEESLINGGDILGESADVANLAMMIADNNEKSKK